MVIIALIDRNPVFCQGLRTLLEQVAGFCVIEVPASCAVRVLQRNPPFDVVLVDEDLYREHRDDIRSAGMANPVMKTLMMVMDRDDLIGIPDGVEKILKFSVKREFEVKIKRLAAVEFLERNRW